MDKKFLHKVIDQILSETIIDYDMGEIQPPFTYRHYYFSSPFHLNPSPSPTLFSSSSPLFSHFSSLLFFKHCREVYGLNDDEIEYVWKEYRKIIKDKLKNNGL